MSLNHVDMIVKMVANDTEWRCTRIYGLSETHNKLHTCELINRLGAENSCDKWTLFGDFNIILSQVEKVDGSFIAQNIFDTFRDSLQHNQFIDFGFI